MPVTCTLSLLMPVSTEIQSPGFTREMLFKVMHCGSALAVMGEAQVLFAGKFGLYPAWPISCVSTSMADRAPWRDSAVTVLP